MNQQPQIPDPEQVKQTVARARRRCREMALVGLQLEDIIARLEARNREVRKQRLKRFLARSATTDAQIAEQNAAPSQS